MSGYVYHDLPWAGILQRPCGQRFHAFGFRGRCELHRHHTGIPHAAERGMVWVRWWAGDNIWLATPGAKDHGPPAASSSRPDVESPSVERGQS